VATNFIGKSTEHIPYKGNVDLKLEECPAESPEPMAFLDQDEISYLSRAGNEFFPHTGAHICLAKEDEAVQKEEIIRSRRVLEKITGKCCASFSYPYGMYTGYSIEMMKENGFTSSYAVINGTNRKGTDLFMIKRHGINNVTNINYFKLALSDRFRIYKQISNLSAGK
jgi:peptidoglycan/xylan/chitin deacetylase (PgdA/CDA1 family)